MIGSLSPFFHSKDTMIDLNGTGYKIRILRAIAVA
jgi:hypothetical protein